MVFSRTEIIWALERMHETFSEFEIVFCIKEYKNLSRGMGKERKQYMKSAVYMFLLQR
jgi:hypothetical protein